MRFVIRKEGKGYFTEFQVVETRQVLAPVDIPPVKKGDVVGVESTYEPLFEAFKPAQAIQFDTEADALAQTKNPDPLMGGPEAFKGCIVEPST